MDTNCSLIDNATEVSWGLRRQKGDKPNKQEHTLRLC